MNDWVGLGYDGSPVVRGYHDDNRPKQNYKWWHSKQPPIKEVDRDRKRDKDERKSEMDLLWEEMRHG